jgi:hypothetical protein
MMETDSEYRARMRRFNDAKRDYEFYDTGLGRVLPDAAVKKWQANRIMWDTANAPARDEIKSSFVNRETGFPE